MATVLEYVKVEEIIPDDSYDRDQEVYVGKLLFYNSDVIRLTGVETLQGDCGITELTLNRKKFSAPVAIPRAEVKHQFMQAIFRARLVTVSAERRLADAEYQLKDSTGYYAELFCGEAPK